LLSASHGVSSIRYTRSIFEGQKKFLAHNEQLDCGVGDLVRIEETRPMSRRKRWIVKEVIRRAN